jgi:hypothetical protein
MHGKGSSPAEPRSQKGGTKEFLFCHEINPSWKAKHEKKWVEEMNMIGY